MSSNVNPVLAATTNVSEKKRKSRSTDDAAAADASKPKKAKTSVDKEPIDLFSIVLEGDENESVEIYDSCDELRKKIRKHLEQPGITKAAFLRDVARAAWPNLPNIQSKQLTDFMTKKGPTAGSTSRVFYASYVYFEKKRIAEGKKKSKHRKDMEDRWLGEGGLPRERERSYFISVNSVLVQDSLGGLRAIPKY